MCPLPKDIRWSKEPHLYPSWGLWWWFNSIFPVNRSLPFKSYSKKWNWCKLRGSCGSTTSEFDKALFCCKISISKSKFQLGTTGANSGTFLWFGRISFISHSVQSFHCINRQCILHPPAVYYRKENKLCHQSYCLLNDDTNHNGAIVRKIQELIFYVLEKLKTID